MSQAGGGSARESAAPEDTPDRVIDCHTHATGIDLVNLGRGRFPTTQSAQDVAYRCAVTGVDFAVCYPIPLPFHTDLNQLVSGVTGGSGAESFPFEFINRQHLFECAATGARRLLPFAAIDPTTGPGAQLRSLDRMAGAIFGLKYHTAIAGASAAVLGPSGFASWAAAAGLPVTVHSWTTPEHSSPAHALELAERHPGLRVNIAHAAGLDLDIVRRIEQLPNAFLDCAPWQLNLHDHHAMAGGGQDGWPTDPLEALIMLHGLAPTSLIWGTDLPWTSRFNSQVRLDFSHKSEVRLLRRLPPSIRRVISWNNTLRWLFGPAGAGQRATAAGLGPRYTGDGVR